MMYAVFLIAVALLIGLLVRNAMQETRQQRQLQEAFYRLLESQNGCIALIQLAATARTDARLAQQYLEQQVKLFGASLETDADGDPFYRFPKLKGLPEETDPGENP
ncbi:hypothetical protein BST81_06450 [Leptolyngbya sp. 'hensonii']|uniref:hypothetical protein n=1 Tax=Leptolyngbya sp. 'hensonii' TaxID=1922337 RepID=UPI00094FF829|nr:hypothetical protein [Leptolyngbya sp. 'hensonii']OLP19434.1 hypothetical protein BST81_06450 [Leptolyngbya sp. 'hensonii']